LKTVKPKSVVLGQRKKERPEQNGMYMCMYIFMYVYVYIFIYVWSMYLHINTHVHICTSIYLHMYMKLYHMCLQICHNFSFHVYRLKPLLLCSKELIYIDNYAKETNLFIYTHMSQFFFIYICIYVYIHIGWNHCFYVVKNWPTCLRPKQLKLIVRKIKIMKMHAHLLWRHWNLRVCINVCTYMHLYMCYLFSCAYIYLCIYLYVST
jgi:hypothetical protein